MQYSGHEQGLQAGCNIAARDWLLRFAAAAAAAAVEVATV
jgi:hypothetical protein